MNDLSTINKNSIAIQEQNSLSTGFESALSLVEDSVFKNYITKLHDLEIVPLDKEVMKNNLAENVRFFKITEMVYEKDEYSTYKFASVFNALSHINSAVFIIVDSDGEKTDFYMGVRSLDSNRTTSSLKSTLENSMKGQFPGIKTKNLMENDMEKIISKINVNSISAVTCVANSKDAENKNNLNFIQGLEKLAITMQGNKYTGIVIANSTSNEQITLLRKSYESIYTNLSAFASKQLSYSTNDSVSMSDTFTKGTSVSDTTGTSKSQTYGKSSSDSTSDSTSVSEPSMGSKLLKGVAVAAVAVAGIALAIPTGGASVAVAAATTAAATTAAATTAAATAATVSGVAAAVSGVASTASQMGKTKSKSHSTSHSESVNESQTTGTNKSVTTGTNESNSVTKGLQQGTTKNITHNITDKSVQNILDRIDVQMERLKEFESLGMWECGAYFISDNQYSAEIAASTYKALMRGENTGVEMSAINSWLSRYDKQKTELLKDYVTNFIHPVFEYNTGNAVIPVNATSFVSGNELAIHMGLPRKSVCGFPVIEHADFGKEVVKYGGEQEKESMKLGKVYNMGSESTNELKLDKESLSMHTFVTGSTGSGKSNTVYEMLYQLDRKNVKFMVIEPAKGEYKNVFGKRYDVKVLSTNPKISELLKINPFKFPSGIHILEHIDKLVEIFNVCWPMYAAMPAVLKEGILNSYKNCGWNLSNSTNQYSDELFPTFSDLETELVEVIKNSAYSEELKSNYTGSLLTRVNSLTNGLNGQIFSSNEVDNNVLFEENVIVDLSRVGSIETKSLIMGILVMRLSEHRMSTAKQMNTPLKHITVLEEAHNILKRTSTDQNPESSNVAGKSVEMISNAIAEMRTYGEGFIIVDQSPNSVDISAIKNTNTKIIMRLPEESDRRLSGKSAGLRDDQLDEIAKLPKGVAVVYQNDWLEPVLCKINKYNGSEEMYVYDENVSFDTNNELNTELMNFLYGKKFNDNVEVDFDKVEKMIINSSNTTRNKVKVIELIKEYQKEQSLDLWKDKNLNEFVTLIKDLLNINDNIQKILNSTDDVNDLELKLTNYIISKFNGFSTDYSMQEYITARMIDEIFRTEAQSKTEYYDMYNFWKMIK